MNDDLFYFGFFFVAGALLLLTHYSAYKSGYAKGQRDYYESLTHNYEREIE